MKKFVLCVLQLFYGFLLFSQSAQPCVVQQYNQEKAKTPLKGVEVIVEDAGTALSDDLGNLTLVFSTLKPGDRVNLISAYKAGFEVFNKSDIKQWNVSKDKRPFFIVMADSKYVSDYQARLRRTSEDSYKTKYHQAVNEIASLKKEGRLKEEEYAQRLSELTREYQESMTNLESYIDQFVHIDLSTVSAEERRILEMVEKGQVDEAVKAYEALNISGKLREARKKLEDVKGAEAQLEKKKADLTSAIEELKEKQSREIATLKLAGGKASFDRVGGILRDNAVLDPSNIDMVWEYACFCVDQKAYRESEKYLLYCLREVGDDLEFEATIHNLIGNMYSGLGQNDKAEQHFLLSLDARTQLDEQFPDFYLPDLARTQHNLGVFYSDLRRYDLAEDYLREALCNRSILCLHDRDTYLEDAANTQNALGTLLREMNNYPEAKLYLRMALSNYTHILEDRPSVAIRKAFADTQMNLGNLLAEEGNLSEAVNYYMKALEIYDQLFEFNPDAYRQDLCGAQANLGLLFRKSGLYEQAEAYLAKALENVTYLYGILPDTYRPLLALVQDDLGIVYSESDRYDMAEAYYQKAIDNYGLLSRKDPDAYAEDLGMTHYHLGVLLTNSGELEKAEEHFLYALGQYSQSRYPRVVHPVISEIISVLLRIASRNGHDFDNYDEVLEKALTVCEGLYKLDPVYQDIIVDLRNRKGHRLLLKNEVDAALSLFEGTYQLAPVPSARYLAEGLHGKSRNQARNWDYKGALQTIDRAIELEPDNEDHYELKGELLFNTGDEKGALEMWNKVLEIYPEYLEWCIKPCWLYESLKGRGLIKE